MRTGSASLLVHGPAHPRHRMRRNDELGQLFETSSIAPNTGISSLGTVHASGCDRHKYKAMLCSSSTILTLASICWVSTDRHRLRRVGSVHRHAMTGAMREGGGAREGKRWKRGAVHRPIMKGTEDNESGRLGIPPAIEE